MPARAAGPSGIDAGDERAARFFEAEAAGDVVIERLDRDADPAARDAAAAQQLLHDAVGGVGGNGEADADIAAGRREDGAVHADDVAVEVERRAARVAAIDRRVDLHVVDVSRRARVAPAHGRDDAGGRGAVETERVADGDDPIADAHVARVVERHVREAPAAAHAQHGDVGGFVGADEVGLEVAAVAGADGDFFGAFDDVMVGDDDAVLIDEEAGAERGRRGARTARTAAEEFFEARRQAFERSARCAASGRWRTEIDTTAGRTRSIRSAKLIGAPRGGATAPGLISWASAPRENRIAARRRSRRTAPGPRRRRSAVRRRNFTERASVIDDPPGRTRRLEA